MSFNPLASIVSKYTAWLNRSPFFSRLITTGSIVASGDILCQTIFEKKSLLVTESSSCEKKPVDWNRVGKALLTGMLVNNTNIYFWYMKCLPAIMRTSYMSSRSKLQKTVIGTVLDQTIFCTSLYSQFFFVLKYLETFDLDEAVNNTKANFWPAMKADWAIWPFITFVNLRMVPLQFQTLVVNVCGVGWNLYLAKLNLDSREQVKQMDSPTWTKTSGIAQVGSNTLTDLKDRTLLKSQQQGKNLAQSSFQ